MTVAIRRPVAEGVDYACVWPPNPAVVVGVGPLAIRIQVFSAPNVLVEILRVVTETLREILLALTYPLVEGVASTGGKQVPIARVVAGNDELRGTPVTQREARGV